MKQMFKKICVLMTVVLASVTVLAGCTSDESARSDEAGVIQWKEIEKRVDAIKVSDGIKKIDSPYYEEYK